MLIAEDELIERRTLWEQGYWEIPDGLDTSNFDFDWKPYVYDKPYIHQFGTQWQKTGGPKFIVPDNRGVKYQDYQRAIKLPDQDNRCWRPAPPAGVPLRARAGDARAPPPPPARSPRVPAPSPTPRCRACWWCRA